MSSLTTNRIKAENRAGINLLNSILEPEVLHARVPRLAEVEEARVEHRNKMNTIQKLGKFRRATGYSPDRQLQYVAQIDQSVWSAVMEVFGDQLYPPGEPMNKKLFYALLEGPLSRCDMRGKIVI